MSNKTLYDELKENGITISNYRSTLYFESTPLSREILDRYPLQKASSSTFTDNITKQLWIDVPFEYMPFWRCIGI